MPAMAGREGQQGGIAGLKQRVDRFIHDPVVELFLILAIVSSVVLIVLAEMEPGATPRQQLFDDLGWAFTGLFTVELLLRYWVARKKRRFFARYWLDIIAVLPWARSLRFMRALRLLRIFRAGALMNRRLSIFRGAVRATAQEVTMLLTGIVALVLTGAMLMQHYEGAGGARSGFEGMGEALLYALASTIAGEPTFGEPSSLMGKLVSLGLMLGGLTIFGLFIGTVSATMMARLSKTMEITVMDLDELSGHTVLCGWNRAGPTVLQELFAKGRVQPVVLITESGQIPNDLPKDVKEDLIYYINGDYTRVEVLEQANITEAASAILLTDAVVQRSDQDRDARTVLAALTIEKLAPEIFTIAELNNRDNESLLRMANVEEIVVSEEYGAVIMGSAERNRGLVRVVDEILTSRYGNAFQKVRVGTATAGKTVAQLHASLKAEHAAILIAHIPCLGGKEQSVDVNPASSVVVNEGDRLVVIAEDAPRLG
jgi:voltage-gated potassium channel